METPSVLRKKWNSVFPKNRTFTEEPFVQGVLDGSEPYEIPLLLFLRNWKTRTPSTSEEIEVFCQPLIDRLQELESDYRKLEASSNETTRAGSTAKKTSFELTHELFLAACIEGGAPQQAKAWLDDRETDSLKAREYPSMLTARQLYLALCDKRFGKCNIPNADRRLLYIKDLDPYFIHALAMTVPLDHVEGLRETIWTHLSLRSAIRATLPRVGNPYVLQFHLAYFPLRCYTSHPDQEAKSCPAPRQRRKFLDLSILDISCLDGNRKDGKKRGTYGAFESHVSFIIFGVDQHRYTCYAFADDDFERGHHDADEEDEDQVEAEVGEEECEGDEYEMRQDPIPSNSEGDVVDAGVPIWDPRLYFLKALLGRSDKCLREWRYIVHIVERSIKRWKRINSSALSSRQHSRYDSKSKEAFDWIMPTIEIIDHFREVLLEVVRSWEPFSRQNGDICYFEDLEDAKWSINEIRVIFESLSELGKTLDGLHRSCKSSAETLKLRLSYEAIEESTHMHSENLRLGERRHAQAHDSSLKTNNVAQKSHGLSQMNFMLGQVYAPIAVSIALFASEREVLPFSRTVGTFIGVTIVLILIANLIALMVFMTSRLPCLIKMVDRLDRMLAGNKRNDPDLYMDHPSVNATPDQHVAGRIPVDHFSGQAPTTLSRPELAC